MIDYKWKNNTWESLDAMVIFNEDTERSARPELFASSSCATCHRLIEFRDGTVACREYAVDWRSREDGANQCCEHWME